MARWANLRQTASYFATTERQLRSMVYDGRLPKTKIGGRLIFDLDAIEASIVAGQQVPGDGPGLSVVARAGRGKTTRRAS